MSTLTNRKPSTGEATSQIPPPQHIDQNGQEFQVPTFTMAEIYAAIPAHCFKPSTLRSMAYAVRDFLYASALLWVATTYIPLLPSSYLRFVAWVAYTTAQGIVLTGVWILAHECGHGGFSTSKTLNNVMGLIMHSILLVPYHSWRITHSRHHKATGNLERDTAFVPHTRDSWVKQRVGDSTADHKRIEFAELAEDAPITALWNALVHQLLGWPGYLLLHLTGQDVGTGDNDWAWWRKSHFWFAADSTIFKGRELFDVALSDAGVAAVILALVAWGQKVGSWNVVIYYVVPWLWVNNWIVAITFLQHTDSKLPHYSHKSWTFARGATATIDRDLGFIDTHFFHDIIGTHVCHHLVSSIPFYHAGEASEAIKKVMGQSYMKADDTTGGVWGFWREFWTNQRKCKFVEETEGREGEGVFMFRNLHGEGAEPVRFAAPKDKEGGDVMGVKMPSGVGARRKSISSRRLSQGVASSAAAALPLLAE
jgi:omega-6 fatty acid desaturase (delta-12 desaturase)